jgi:hypothetical protein
MKTSRASVSKPSIIPFRIARITSRKSWRTATSRRRVNKIILIHHLQSVNEELSGPIRVAGGKNPDAVEPDLEV